MQHGRILVELPADWTDRSTLLFVGPAPPAPPTTQVKQAQPSVSVTFVHAPSGDDAARRLLDDELAGLAGMNVGFEAIGTEAFSCPLGEGVLSRHRLSLQGVALRQLHAVVVRGTLAVKAAASCAEMDAPQLEASLLSTLQSLRLA